MLANVRDMVSGEVEIMWTMSKNFFSEDEGDMKLSPPVYYKKPLGNPRGGQAKNGKQLQTGGIWHHIWRWTEIWKKCGGKYGCLALEIISLI